MAEQPELLSRKAYANAPLGVDVSDSESSSTVKSQGHATSLENRGPIETRQFKSLLLDLPTEIRLEIYDLLLVSRFNRWDNSSWATGNTYQKPILLSSIQAPQYRTMEPAILRTCKQIYHEAIPILYSRNVFSINSPGLLLQLMARIGPTNTRLIRSLDIHIPALLIGADKTPWLDLFHILPNTATGLGSVVVYWWGDVSVGKDFASAQALAKLRDLPLTELRFEGLLR
ncbi:hypothetical protein F5Y17DRAFT_448480 [Xylariaceae sp. FL0594]|nr:hypothetical protein F5Y17DRAFT_448480 [Xylariaceae sp. FL0594]